MMSTECITYTPLWIISIENCYQYWVED